MSVKLRQENQGEFHFSGIIFQSLVKTELPEFLKDLQAVLF